MHCFWTAAQLPTLKVRHPVQTELSTALTRNSNAAGASFQQRVLGNVVVALAGGTLVLAGLVMIFLPGPGMLMVLGGLSLLATKFAFARRWLGFARSQFDRLRSRVHHA